MKIRFGFISNSSSTSFTCPACTNHFEGWDWEDDPVCDKCGCHITHYVKSFSSYLIEKYNLNEVNERCEYLRVCEVETDEELRDRIKKELGHPSD